MVKIVGVRFRDTGKSYYFDPKDFELKSGMHVIVETVHGLEYGTVSGGIREITDDKITQPLKGVIRIATPEDDEKIAANRIREREAMAICKEKIRKHELEMKLIDVEYAFDNNKILFYFTADGRIDFRELVKDLASVFRTRIELRQIGVRDETKILGGIGICGRPLCCSTWLSDFVPVSIKMAKEQNLSLNPTKISGLCGRLMCCLKNEEATYEYLNSRLPSVGDTAVTPDGVEGIVTEVNVLRQKVKLMVENDGDKELMECLADDLSFRSRKRRDKKGGQSPDGEEERSEKPEGRPERKEGREERRADRREGGEKKERRDRSERRDKDSRREGRKDRQEGEGRDRREPREPRKNREENGRPERPVRGEGAERAGDEAGNQERLEEGARRKRPRRRHQPKAGDVAVQKTENGDE